MEACRLQSCQVEVNRLQKIAQVPGLCPTSFWCHVWPMHFPVQEYLSRGFIDASGFLLLPIRLFANLAFAVHFVDPDVGASSADFWWEPFEVWPGVVGRL